MRIDVERPMRRLCEGSARRLPVDEPDRPYEAEPFTCGNRPDFADCVPARAPSTLPRAAFNSGWLRAARASASARDSFGAAATSWFAALATGTLAASIAATIRTRTRITRTSGPGWDPAARPAAPDTDRTPRRRGPRSRSR